MIPQSPLEKVARAMYAEATSHQQPFEMLSDGAQEHVRRAARAALTALLDPDEGTVEAMFEANKAEVFREECVASFNAAIQHILKGKADE